jgi:hypothetical protein
MVVYGPSCTYPSFPTKKTNSFTTCGLLAHLPASVRFRFSRQKFQMLSQADTRQLLVNASTLSRARVCHWRRKAIATTKGPPDTRKHDVNRRREYLPELTSTLRLGQMMAILPFDFAGLCCRDQFVQFHFSLYPASAKILPVRANCAGKLQQLRNFWARAFVRSAAWSIITLATVGCSSEDRSRSGVLVSCSVYVVLSVSCPFSDMWFLVELQELNSPDSAVTAEPLSYQSPRGSTGPAKGIYNLKIFLHGSISVVGLC